MALYVLQNKIPRKVHLREWDKWMDKPERRRVDETHFGDICISTVFLGLDHNFTGIGPPLFFETMIFGGKHDGYQTRCSTWEQAEEMHKKAVHLARSTKR